MIRIKGKERETVVFKGVKQGHSLSSFYFMHWKCHARVERRVLNGVVKREEIKTLNFADIILSEFGEDFADLLTDMGLKPYHSTEKMKKRRP